MSNISVFIDESGTLSDQNDKVIVVAAIGTYDSEEIAQIEKKIRKKSKLRKNTGEFKFYTAGDRSKNLFFKELKKYQLDIFILIVDKIDRKIKDTPQNYAAICWMLLIDIENFYSSVKEIVLDRHFHLDRDIDAFDQYIGQLLNNSPKIRHADSRKDKRIIVADMIAGAFLSKETGKNTDYYNFFADRIVIQKRIKWDEAKKIFLEKIKK